MKKAKLYSRMTGCGMQAALLALITAIAVRAQTTPTPFDIPQRGIVPNGSYSLDKIETIDVVSGNASVHIPITSLPAGRAGSSLGLELFYNSTIYVWGELERTTGILSPYLQGSNQVSPDEFGGWHYGYNYEFVEDIFDASGTGPLCSLGRTRRFRVITPDGSSHTLYILGNNNDASGAYSYAQFTSCGQTGPPEPTTFYTADGTYLRLTKSAGIWMLYFPDGRVVTGTDPAGNGGDAASIADRNGNTVLICRDLEPGTNYPRHTLLEALQPGASCSSQAGNRSITIVFGPSQDLITQTGYNNQQNQWTVQTKSITLAAQHYYNCAPNQPSQCDAGVVTSFIVVDSLTLPNGQQYTFCYNGSSPCNDSSILPSDGWAQLARITLPSGANGNYLYAGPISDGWGGGASPQILSKTLNWTDENLSVARSEPSSYTYNSTYTDVTGPDGGIARNYFSVATDQQGGRGPLWHLVYRVENWINGTNPQTLEKVWAQNIAFGSGIGPVYHYPANPFVQTELRSVDSQKTAVKISAVDRNGNPLSTVECDWVSYGSLGHNNTALSSCPGSTVRTTQNTYVLVTPDPSTLGSPSTTDDTNGYWNNRSQQLLSFTSRTQTSGVGSGSITEFTYDLGGAFTKGNATQVRHWDSVRGTSSNPLTSNNAVITNNTYDSYGNLLTTQNPRGNTTSYTYGAVCGSTPLSTANLYPTAIVLNGVETFTFTWDCYAGTKLTDTNGHSLTRFFDYDRFGRIFTVKEGSTRQTKFTYNDPARTITTQKDKLAFTDALLIQVDNFDQLGRLRQTVDPAGNTVQSSFLVQSGGLSYVATSNPYATTGDPTMGWTLTTRDVLGRTTAVASYSGAGLPSPIGTNNTTTGSSTNTYSADCATSADPANVSRTSCVDGLGRLASVTENGLSSTTTYSYDALDNLTSVNQPGNGLRSFSYSSLKRLISATNPENGTISYTYDGNGNVLTRADARNVTTTYTYDALDQILTKSYNDNPQTPGVSYTYDKSWLTQVNSGGTSYNYTGFDSIGRVTAANQTTNNTSYAFLIQHMPFVGVKSIQYPGTGRVVTTNYDSAGRPKTVTGQIGTNPLSYYVGDGNQANDVQYAPNGGILSMKLGNGLVGTTTYNSRLQPTQITAGSLLTLGYCYRAVDCTTTSTQAQNNGNVLQQVITRGSSAWTQNYSYDGANRLGAASENGTGSWSQTNCYDARGNRWVRTNTTGLPAMTLETPQGTDCSVGPYAANNRMSSGWTYDAAGNITTSGTGRTFLYDAENRQKSATVNSQTSTYTYDGDGRRVQKTAPSGTTIYVYDPFGQLAQEYGPSTDIGTKYLHTDALGSTRMVTKADGTVDKNYDYLPFGDEIGSGTAGRDTTFPGSQYPHSPTGQSLEFTSQVRDAETGLDFFQARYFSSAQGRFTSPDGPFNDQSSSDPQSWNLYSYARNNPLKFTDPLGQSCVSGGGNAYYDDDKGGQTCAEAFDPKNNNQPSVTVGVGRDEANLIMLQMVGEQLSSPHQWADMVSHAGQSAASVLAPLPTATAQCATGNCDKTSVALAMVPHVPGVPRTAVGQFVKNRKLRNILAAFNRTGTGIGTGSTADAIRYELQTGNAVGGKFHYTKGVELRDGLLNLWRNPILDSSDRAVIRELLSDLQEALSRK